MKQLFETTARAARGGSIVFATGAVALSLIVVACSDDDTDAGDPSALATDDAGSTVDSGGSTTIDAGDTSTVEDAGTDADAGPTEVETAAQRCETTITNPTETAGFVELCKPAEGTVQHVTIVGAQAAATHKYVEIVFGADTAPASSTGALTTGQARVLLYGGGPAGPSTVPATTQIDFEAASEEFGSNASSYVNQTFTVCFDVTDGAAAVAPKLTLWVDGQKGASCADRSTQTAATAFGTTATWAAGTIAKDKKVWFGSSAAIPGPVVTLSSVPSL